MPKRSGGQHWRKRQSLDADFQSAKRLGYRSRAGLKLLEIQRRRRLFKPGAWVLDLGAAPGGWSQVAVQHVGAGRVIGVDLLPIAPLSGATFLQADLLQPQSRQLLQELLPEQGVSLVISDMAPNISGIRLKDQADSLLLAQLAFEQALQYLQPAGSFLVKLFQGPEVKSFHGQVKPYFKALHWIKPKASRADSSEIYLLAEQRLQVLQTKI